jgi:F-type H+-transporting ATPase subunit delta
MKATQLAFRYAKSIFEIARDAKNDEKVLDQLRALDTSLQKDPEVLEFLSSPLFKLEDRERALEQALKGANAINEVHQLLMLLVRNGRISIYSQVVEAFQTLIDNANGVVRGTVRSAATLSPAERQQIESTVEKVLNKKVIMTYKVDPTVIGGLVAQAGSYTFDDSIKSHLQRLNDELKRRAL